MHIREAYKVSRRMGRSGDGLDVSYFARLFKRGRYGRPGPLNVVTARVKGGTQSHKCVVVWPGKTNDFTPLKASKPCAWHCDCSDFLFTFYPHLVQQDNVVVELELGESKGTGPRRSIDEPGLCKHLMAVVDVLRDDELITR